MVSQNGASSSTASRGPTSPEDTSSITCTTNAKFSLSGASLSSETPLS